MTRLLGVRRYCSYQGKRSVRMKKNCWEFKRCGRQLGGLKSVELGVCPASTEEGLEGVHGGTNGGRACWVVAGTLCGGEVQGTYAKKSHNCRVCNFYKLVEEEEGDKVIGTFTLMTMVKGKVPV